MLSVKFPLLGVAHESNRSKAKVVVCEWEDGRLEIRYRGQKLQWEELADKPEPRRETSAGRGENYQTAISADWGNKEVLDLQAAVDHVLSIGLADPARLGVGGWSYGGILTDAIIAKDQRFKAATSGAGTAFPLALYGVDQYIMQYDEGIGPPWKVGLDPWNRIAYAFLHADQIKMPTLFLGGEKDFNVPLAGGEQMYQALRASRRS